MFLNIWITGSTRSGKTTRLIHLFRQWVQRQLQQRKSLNDKRSSHLTPAVLVFAANNDNRRNLADKLSSEVQGSYPVTCKTPLGFISDEVTLFFPLLFEPLQIKAQFPLRLRPETEQDLATKLWRPELDKEALLLSNLAEYRLIRRILDLLQLAGASGISVEDIPTMLINGQLSLISGNNFSDDQTKLVYWAEKVGKLLLDWRSWCLERALLSYGLIYELYWRYLLPNPDYQQYLTQRYQAIFADDVDDYPAIARDLCEFLLDQGAYGVFTYNPDGKIRLGLNADPDYLTGLSARCQIETLSSKNALGIELTPTFIDLITEPILTNSLPDAIASIQTTSRADLLRQTAETIIKAVKSGTIQPREIAIIAPGLDEIARYSLLDILLSQGIPVQPLNEQRALISSPFVRALLTFLCLVYPGLGRLIPKDTIAEMLVIFSQQPGEKLGKFIPQIDPVRAGLIADYCYQIDLNSPRLLPVTAFPRWDRLGHKATQAYQEIVAWLETVKIQQQQQALPQPIFLLDLAIKHFFANGINFAYDQLEALRELMETAQHFWEVDRRLRYHEPLSLSPTATIAQFIQLLRRGTITANALPLQNFTSEPANQVTLATIFQYRSIRQSHRWHFWLDAGSRLWEQGGASTLFAAPLFLRNWSGKPLTPENDLIEGQERLERIIRDLLGRVEEKIYLCHSDLGVNGTEQVGALLSLVHAAKEISLETVTV